MVRKKIADLSQEYPFNSFLCTLPTVFPSPRDCSYLQYEHDLVSPILKKFHVFGPAFSTTIVPYLCCSLQWIFRIVCMSYYSPCPFFTLEPTSSHFYPYHFSKTTLSICSIQWSILRLHFPWPVSIIQHSWWLPPPWCTFLIWNLGYHILTSLPTLLVAPSQFYLPALPLLPHLDIGVPQAFVFSALHDLYLIHS